MRGTSRAISSAAPRTSSWRRQWPPLEGVRRNRRHQALLCGHRGRRARFRIELDGVEGVDSKRAIAFLRISSTGRASGIRMAPPLTNLYDLLDGKISRIRIFLDRQVALKAVGLEG